MSVAGSGYLSGNMLVAFPFEDGHVLAWTEQDRALEMQEALQRCFVDASVCLKARSVETGEWPSIGDFAIDGDSLSFVLHAKGERVPVTVSGSSPTRFPIVSGAAPWGTYVVVLSSEGISDFCSISPPAGGLFRSSSVGGEGASVRLCAKCVTLSAAVVDSILVYNGVDPFEDGPHSVIRGDMIMKPGNNMRLAGLDDDPVAIELNAEPGAGLGVIPCTCEEDTTGLLIGGADGHARVFNDTCYDLEPSTTTGILQMHAKCTACCTCGMYESIVNDRLAALADAVRRAKLEIADMHNAYESAVKKFNDRISRPFMSDVTMTFSGMPIGSKISPNIDNEDVKGKMERCVFTAIVSNSSYFEISVRISRMTGTDTVVEASAAWSDASGAPLSVTGDGPGAVTSRAFSVYPGRSLVVTFVAVKSEMVSKVVTGGYTGSVSAEVSWSEGYLGSLDQTVSV